MKSTQRHPPSIGKARDERKKYHAATATITAAAAADLTAITAAAAVAAILRNGNDGMVQIGDKKDRENAFSKGSWHEAHV